MAATRRPNLQAKLIVMDFGAIPPLRAASLWPERASSPWCSGRPRSGPKLGKTFAAPSKELASLIHKELEHNKPLSGKTG